MTKISILEILLVSFLLLMPIIAGYLGLRVLKLNRRVKQVQADRDELLEERAKQSNKLRLKGIEMDEMKKEMCSDILFRTITDGEKFIGELLSDLEKKMILAALNMPEYGDAIKDPKTSFEVRKVYGDLKEKVKDSLKD